MAFVAVDADNEAKLGASAGRLSSDRDNGGDCLTSWALADAAPDVDDGRTTPSGRRTAIIPLGTTAAVPIGGCDVRVGTSKTP